jgi:hypothetical protein
MPVFYLGNCKLEAWPIVYYLSPPSAQVVAPQQQDVTENCVPQQRSGSRACRTWTTVSPCANSIRPRFIPPPEFNVTGRDPQRMVQRQPTCHGCLQFGHTCSLGTTMNHKKSTLLWLVLCHECLWFTK